MKRGVFLALSGIVCSCSCSWHAHPRGDIDSRQSVLSFLDSYAMVQQEARKLVGAYDPAMRPGGESPKWVNMRSGYDKILQHGYECRFDLAETKFGVTCSSKGFSRPGRLSFYLDESLIIRIAARGESGPMSPQLRSAQGGHE